MKKEVNYEKILEEKEQEIKRLNDEVFFLKNTINNQCKLVKIALKLDGILVKVKRKLRNFIHNIIPRDKKRGMIVRLVAYSILHPIHAYQLFIKIKKGNPHFGDNTLDIFYLKYGKLNFKNHENPKVSIIIPVYNQLYFTYKCLRSIYKLKDDVNYEIIIADDVSTDATRYLNSYVPNINIIRNKKNLRFLLNCNNAAKSAKGKYILFLNNDTEVCQNWLSSLVELIESDESIGMVGSKFIYPNGTLNEAGGIIFSDGSGWNYGRFDDPTKPQYNYIRDVDYISGASMMLSKHLWNQIGGFDERFVPAYCEDSDLAFAVRKAGYRVVYQPKSVLIHYEGISNGNDTNNSKSLKHYQVENNKKLCDKWQKELKQQPKSSTNINNFAFRDRFNGKKVMLFMDYGVPKFDQDAGSKTTYQYLKMFLQKGYFIKFLANDFRINEPYTSILEQMGIEVLSGFEYQNNILDWIKINGNNFDYAYLNRPAESNNYIDTIKEYSKAKIFYYGHDLHHLRLQREYEITKDEERKKLSEYVKDIEFSVMKKSDYVYYPSYVEKEIIKKHDKTINVKAIQAYIYDNVNNQSENFENRDGLMFVGGFNHTPNVDAVLWFVKEVYPLILKKKKIKLYIIGSNPKDSIKNLASNNIIVKGFLTTEELDEMYTKCKIDIVPLRYGAGIKGKVVEAMSKGMPIVTTSVGAEGLEKVNNVLPVVDNPQDFANKILELYDDESKLDTLSKKEKEYIQDNFSLEHAWNIIKDDFK